MAIGHKCGIYVIEQIGTERYYIGSSKAIRERWSSHRWQLSKGTHHSPYLQNSWNKYGESAFKFWIIEECSVDELESKEQQYITAFNPEFNAVIVVKSRTLRPESKAKQDAAIRARAALITHCPKGHEYSAENTAFDRKGKRLCRACNRERVAGVYAKETAEQKTDRLSRMAEYYARTKADQQEQRRAYLLAHKSDKQAYDNSRRALTNEQRRQRRVHMTAEQRQRYLEMKRRSYQRCKAA